LCHANSAHHGARAYPLDQGEISRCRRPCTALHANIGETSAVMAIDESLVDLERAVEEYPQFPTTPSQAVVAAFFFSGKRATYRATRSGVWGHPRQSSAERGRAYLDQIEDAGARFIGDVEQVFRSFPPPQMSAPRSSR
jgi:creatinine amidohydrolase/Fe(II)-dependent formamide hydrolase-like protein